MIDPTDLHHPPPAFPGTSDLL